MATVKWQVHGDPGSSYSGTRNQCRVIRGPLWFDRERIFIQEYLHDAQAWIRDF